MKRLICFAVAEEQRFFQPYPDDVILVTGMGAYAAERALKKSLLDVRPDLIVAAGFAGGLNPDLVLGQVVLDDREGRLAGNLNARVASGSLFEGRIHSSSRVLVSPYEKSKCRSETHADAVDMESESIRRIASEKGIAMIALRAISDTAHEMLPLDFNRFMTPDGGMRFGRLMTHLLLHPAKIPSLIGFQRKVKIAARTLGEALNF